MKDGVVDIDLDIKGAEVLWLVATDGEKGMSYDWITWIAPKVVAGERSRLLTDLPGARRARDGAGSTSIATPSAARSRSRAR